MQMHIKNREVVILLVVSLMAFIANLPEGAIGRIVDRNTLLVTLVVTVFISLFRYLKLMLFITVSVLAIGANLPDQLASQLGVSSAVMIVASGVLVVMAMLYKFYHLQAHSSKIEYQDDTVCYRHDTINSRNDVIAAILNGDIATLHQLLLSDVEINFSQNGHIPIFAAIESGYEDMVLMLLFYGAKLRVRNKEGQMPIEFALQHNELRAAKIIRYASEQNLTVINNGISKIQQKDNIAVMFADICGSTALYEQFGNETALKVITRTLSILTQEVAMHKGSLIKTIGDEIMCTFPSVDLATRAACAMHSAIDARRPGGEHPIHVRIGFHYGEVIHKANDVFGDTVNVAARVTAITRARQIMTTQAVVDALPPKFTEENIRPIMRAAFQGKQDVLAMFQIKWEPENAMRGRIGISTFREQRGSANESFSDIQPIAEYRPQAAHKVR